MLPAEGTEHKGSEVGTNAENREKTHVAEGGAGTGEGRSETAEPAVHGLVGWGTGEDLDFKKKKEVMSAQEQCAHWHQDLGL